VFIEKLVIIHLVTKLAAFIRLGRFVTLFTRSISGPYPISHDFSISLLSFMSLPRFPKCCLSWDYQETFYMHFLFPYVCHMPHSSYFPLFNHPNSIRWSSFVCNYLYPPLVSSCRVHTLISVMLLTCIWGRILHWRSNFFGIFFVWLNTKNIYATRKARLSVSNWRWTYQFKYYIFIYLVCVYFKLGL
jgi:hypothetical protein